MHAAGVVAVLLADACARWWPAPSPPVLARLAVGYASLSWAAGIAGPVLAVAVGAVNTVAANGASNKGSLVNKAAVRAFRWGCSGVAVGHAALCVYVLSSSGLLTVLDAVAAAKKDDDGAVAVRAGKPAARPPPPSRRGPARAAVASGQRGRLHRVRGHVRTRGERAPGQHPARAVGGVEWGARWRLNNTPHTLTFSSQTALSRTQVRSPLRRRRWRWLRRPPRPPPPLPAQGRGRGRSPPPARPSCR